MKLATLSLEVLIAPEFLMPYFLQALVLGLVCLLTLPRLVVMLALVLRLGESANYEDLLKGRATPRAALRVRWRVNEVTKRFLVIAVVPEWMAMDDMNHSGARVLLVSGSGTYILLECPLGISRRVP